MKQAGRLQSAKIWIPNYTGKNIVQGYRKHFDVDLLCAIKELQILGITIDSEYIEQIKRTVEAKLKKEQVEEVSQRYDSDENFSYIAGYTSWGFAYGKMCPDNR